MSGVRAAAWSPKSWRDKPIVQVPDYRDPKAVAEVEAKLATFPPLVFAGETDALKAKLADVALGGPAGLGTVLVALFVGPSVARGYRIVDGFAAASLHTVTTTHGAIIARELQRVG